MTDVPPIDDSNNALSAPHRLLTLSEAGAQLGVSAKTLRRAIATGCLRGTFVGRSVRVRPADLDAYLASDLAERPQRLRDS